LASLFALIASLARLTREGRSQALKGRVTKEPKPRRETPTQLCYGPLGQASPPFAHSAHGLLTSNRSSGAICPSGRVEAPGRGRRQGVGSIVRNAQMRSSPFFRGR